MTYSERCKLVSYAWGKKASKAARLARSYEKQGNRPSALAALEMCKRFRRTATEWAQKAKASA